MRRFLSVLCLLCYPAISGAQSPLPILRAAERAEILENLPEAETKYLEYIHALLLSNPDHPEQTFETLSRVCGMYQTEGYPQKVERTLLEFVPAIGPGNPQNPLHPLLQLGRFYESHGQSVKAEKLYRKLLASVEVSAGKFSSEADVGRRLLAEELALSGKPHDAEALYRAAIQEQESLPAPDASKLVNYLLALAAIYDDFDRPKEALQARLDAVRATETHPPLTPQAGFSTFSVLMEDLRRAGMKVELDRITSRFELIRPAAMAEFQKSSVSPRSQDPDRLRDEQSRRTPDAKAQEAVAKQRAEAESFARFRDEVQAKRESIKAQVRTALTSASTAAAGKRVAEADGEFARALALTEHAGRITARDMLFKILSGANNAYVALNLWDKEREWATRILRASEEICGADDPGTVALLDQWASICASSKHAREAREFEARAEAAEVRRTGARSQERLTMMDLTQSAPPDPGDVAEIERGLQKELTALEEAQGKQHPALIEPLLMVAQAYDVWGHGAKAQPLLDHAWSIAPNKSKKYSDHDVRIDCLASQALHYYLQKQPGKVEEVYKQAVALSRPGVYPEPLDVGFLRAYSLKLYTLGFAQEAERIGLRLDEAGAKLLR